MLYSLMVRAHESGLPIWQPTFAVFQNDPATYDEGVDFMFGDSLLVANVVEKGQTVRPVYLPKTENENERFYNFYTREEYAPGQTIEVPVDISSIPLFVRSGAILPMSGNRLHNLMTEKTTELEILMAPDVDSEFVLYEDDGCTNEYLKGAYLKTRIAVTAGDVYKRQVEIMPLMCSGLMPLIMLHIPWPGFRSKLVTSFTALATMAKASSFLANSAIESLIV